MELNLRPSSLVKAEKQAAQRPYIIAAGVCALAAAGAWWQYYEHAATSTQAVTQSLADKVAPLKAIEEKTKSARAEIANLSDSARPLTTVARERDYWINVLADLNERIPKDYIWITNFEVVNEVVKKDADEPPRPTSGKSKPPKGEERAGPTVVAMVKGLYLSREAGNNAGPAVVDEFIAKLKESPYVEPIEDPGAGYMRANDDTNDWAFKFVLPLKLKNPIAVQ